MGRFLTITIGLLIGVLFASPVRAGEARPKFPPDETLTVPSLTLTDEQFLHGGTQRTAFLWLSRAQIRFPNWNEHLPVVVLLPGSDGHGGVRRWVGANSSTKWVSPRSASTVLAGASSNSRWASPN